jgi:hypothetical protein
MGNELAQILPEIQAMDISAERESIVAIVSLQESKFFLYKYVKNG